MIHNKQIHEKSRETDSRWPSNQPIELPSVTLLPILYRSKAGKESLSFSFNLYHIPSSPRVLSLFPSYMEQRISPHFRSRQWHNTSFGRGKKRKGGMLRRGLCAGRFVYLRSFQSSGAAHSVAQCVRWKTSRVLNVSKRPFYLSFFPDFCGGEDNSHSSTQSSWGPLKSASSEFLVTRSTHSS